MTSDSPPEPEAGMDGARAAIFRDMPCWQKAAQIALRNRSARAAAAARIQAAHPAASEAEQQLRLAVLFVDRETMIRLFGWDPDLERP